MARMQRSLFAQLNALADEISQSTKAAAEKVAGPTPSDPGGYQGASSHPTTSVDNNVQNADTGARAAEYETDIKKQQGALSVDNAPEMSQEGRQNEVQLNINTNAKSTGEDPAAEKDFKGTKDDPGTTSPVKANDGEKYSSASFKEARNHCGNLGNDILANLINFGTDKLTKKSDDHLTGGQKKLDVNDNGKIDGSDLAALRSGKAEAGSEAGDEKSDAGDEKEEKSDAGDEKAAAFKAGYELAAHFGMDKAAAEASVREVCANTLREADEMADLFMGFLSSKQAAADPTEEASEGEDHGAPADVGSGAAPAGLEAMLGAEGGEPAADAGSEGLEGAGPSEDEAVQELAMALEELGIPPEALLEAVAGGEAGAAGGMPGPEAGAMPPEAAGMPPEAAGMAPKMAAAKKASELRSIGAAVMNFKRAGKFQVKEARTKRSRQLRDIMKQHVIELVNR
jgi:hypothetical protein